MFIFKCFIALWFEMLDDNGKEVCFKFELSILWLPQINLKKQFDKFKICKIKCRKYVFFNPV